MPELHDPLEDCPNPKALGGLHKWEVEYLWPEQWLPEGGTPAGEPIGERAYCIYCGLLGDVAQTYEPERADWEGNCF